MKWDEMTEIQRDALVIKTFEFPYNPVDFQPTSDMSDAWEVVEKMLSQQVSVEVKRGAYPGAQWRVEIGAGIRTEAEAAPEAICKAALLTVGVEIE